AFVREQLSTQFDLRTALEKLKKTKESSMRKFVFRRAAEEITHKPDRRSTPGPPLWVKVFGIIAISASLLFLSMMLASMDGMSSMSGMDSSPGRYLPLWIQVSGFIALVVALLFFIAMLAGVGGNGRDRKREAPSGRPALLMSSSLRKLTLTAHIAASVGW